MIQRQVAYAIRDGRSVSFSVFDEDCVTGYIAGEDDQYWFVLEPLAGGGFRQNIIAKAMVSRIIIGASSYATENSHSEMDKIAGPFRRTFVKKYFDQPATSRKAV